MADGDASAFGELERSTDAPEPIGVIDGEPVSELMDRMVAKYGKGDAAQAR